MRISTSLFVVLLGLVLTTSPATAQSANSTYTATINTCGGTEGTITGHIDWPSSAPLWSFDFIRPANSVGDDGSGLEIVDVYYDGHKVFDRAHVPVVNVEYEPGGCGCFRDWMDSEAGYATDGIRSGGESCFADATPGVVQMTCESNEAGGSGGDPGSFKGVAVEEYENELVLSSSTKAGWYRYGIKWHFYTDGRLWPEITFTVDSATCTDTNHRHHAYWRFDFDLDGTPDNDVVREINPTAGTEITFTNEANRDWGNAADGIFWDVRDETTGFGYQIVPSVNDLLLPIDGFSKTDALILLYDPDELDDPSSGCAINYTSEQNGENLIGEDIVFWYRSGAFHPGGIPFQCAHGGPTLNPISPVANGPTLPEEIPDGFVLERAYPNPFNPSTTVRFKVAESQNVTLVLIDALGRQVAELYNGYVNSNTFETIRVDGSGLPSGAYTVRLAGETVQGSTRIALIK